jgi:glycosyltransferase involved in cell wall biosynthesis
LVAAPRVSIVIRAFNEARHIEPLLKGIHEQTFTDYEIILVDSGSTDNTVAIAERYQVTVVHIPSEEFTFGRSLNRGIAAAAGEFIVNISAHCRPMDDHWLANLLAPFEDQEIALAYGMQRGAPASRYSERQFFALYYPPVSHPRQVDPFCNNANAAIRRALWETNPYDESLTGLEDLAWASWALQSGYYIAYVAEAGVIHVHEERPAQVFNRYKREAIAMKTILPDSRYTLRNFLRLWVSRVFSDWRFAFAEGVWLAKAWEIIWFRFMQFWGTYQGYNFSGEVSPELRQTFYYSPRILTENRTIRD